MGTAVGKHGTPKCEFIVQLARVSEPENRDIDPLGVWVGAHPSLGEKFTHEMLKRGLVKELGEVVDIKREVAKVCGTDMRVDFVVTHKDGTRTALEVKTVVDADYNPAIIRFNEEQAKAHFLGHETPYRRAAIFPWGEIKAHERGVKVLAYRVAWGTGDEEGVAFFDGAL